ncbi:MAG: glutamyl-tRNA reductase [Cyclobacteriaceae bacterium]|nr:glutamyl-tRNA reductase [Cyclobacteriaceae bacterium]
MYQNFKVAGLSHQTSAIELREHFSFSEEEVRGFLVQLKEVLGLEEALIVSTCNRTEIYYNSEADLLDQIVSLMIVQKGLENKEGLKAAFHQRTGSEAVRHLFRVSLGLDAKVLGDIQISNQIKRAYQCAADENMAGPFIHRLMHSIFYANKRVVQETAFRDGAASTAYASVDLINQFIVNYKNPKILVVGVGEIGEDVIGNLEDIQAEVTIANRTLSKAELLAHKYQFNCLGLEDALLHLDQFHVVVSSVAVKHPLIDTGVVSSGSYSHRLFIDLSVPRSIDPEIETVPGVLLYNIDQIEEKTQSTLERRKASVVDVENILEQSLVEFFDWTQEMEVSPTIKKLKQALEDIRQEELGRYLKKADKQQAELLDKVTKSIIQKFIKLPVLQLKAACKRGEAETLVEVLNDLFNLEKEAEKVN